MAWTAPRTWADGELPTAAQFNTHFRDNLNELALHSHSGGSGSGTAAIGQPLGINFIQFADGALPGGAGGTVTRLASTAGTFVWVSPSGSQFLASDSTHTHSPSFSAVMQDPEFSAGGAPSTNTLTTFSTFVDVQSNATWTSTGSAGVVAVGRLKFERNTAIAFDAHYRILIDGTQFGTGNADALVAGRYLRNVNGFVGTLASGTHTLLLQLQYTGTEASTALLFYPDESYLAATEVVYPA